LFQLDGIDKEGAGGGITVLDDEETGSVRVDG
jgi:hypothetical protein